MHGAHFKADSVGMMPMIKKKRGGGKKAIVSEIDELNARFL